MGSTATADRRPYVRLINVPSLFSFVPQKPLSPGFITHFLGQMVHLTLSLVKYSTNLDSKSKAEPHVGKNTLR